MINQELFSKTIIDVLRYHALNNPNKPAYTFLNQAQKETLTSHELLVQVTHMASYLMASALPGSRALLLLQPGFDYIISFLGCLMAGIIAIPMYPPRGNRHAQRVFSIVNDANATIVITTHATQQSLDLQNVHYILVDKEWKNTPEHNTFPALTRENLAFLQYTSGSTGSPKGVMITHGNILANTSASRQILTDKHTTLCSWLPPFHDMGLIGAILYPLFCNMHSILMAPATFLKNPFIWLKTIHDYRVNISPAPNFAYEMCINAITEAEKKELDLSCWNVALNGAEPVSAKTLERFSDAFRSCGFKAEFCYPAYGMAETTLMVSGKRPGTPTKLLQVSKSALQSRNELEQNSAANDLISVVGCGYPASNHLVKIIDPQTTTEIPPLHIGEIVVTGPSVSPGYWGKEEVNQEVFGLTLGNTHHHYLRTGDLGFIDEQGELFVTGRLKDLMIIRGYNLYPQDVEYLVSESHPSLIKHGCAAFMLEIADEPELVIVQEVHRHAAESEQIFDAILQQCAQELPLLPARIILIPQITLPKTSSGKVQRTACRQALMQNELKIIAQWERAQIAPTLPTSTQSDNSLIQWMKEWLTSRINIPKESIDTQTNLAHYGVDSSLATQFCGALEQQLHQEINPSLLWTYSTLNDLSQYLMFGVKKKTQESPAHHTPMESIAIIGMSCRFPGNSSSPEAFWELLRTQTDAITEIPKERWDNDFYEEIINKGGFIENIDAFDASLFNISRREAEAMDPQHRILLELSWEALERAGIAPLSLEESNTGIFIGIASNDYSQIMREHLEYTDAYYGIGNAHSAAAGRIAYFLGTHGESIALDTACSSSLVAVFNACLNLQENECDLALVGGVNVILDPALNISFAKAGMLSPEGACKVFDAEANGYVRSEGAAVVVLKRLTDAQRDNNHILAVIKGMAVNSDGHSNGITAPNAQAQSELISKALHSAGITADNISYIEAHGTGTRLGDPIEFSALNEVFATGTREMPLSIGSVKSNIGHLEACAGMAGLIKTVLMLQHRQIPANLHFKRVNPLIDLDTLPAQIPTDLQAWQHPSLRYAGVSSFGFTGTNAHLILAEYPATEPPQTTASARPIEIATLSAHTLESLEQQKLNLLNFITNQPTVDLSSLCHTLNTSRSALRYRCALSAQNRDQLLEQLTSSIAHGGECTNQPPKIAFLFTGQGAQYTGMGLALYQTHPLFQEEMDSCFNLLQDHLPISLKKVLFEQEYADYLTQTCYMQPALFVLQYALAKLWISWGIKPEAVIGHSVGEYIAATIAGVMGLADALKLITARGKLMQQMQPGSMLAVEMDTKQASTLLEHFKPLHPQASLNIAAINSKRQVVFAGNHEACVQLQKYCQSLTLRTSFLNVSHAFHSELMAPMLSEFKKIAAEIPYHAPQITLISNVTGKAITDINAEYWADHVLAPVFFSAGIEELVAQKFQIFMEMGPQPTLINLLYEHFPTDNPPLLLGVLNKKSSNWATITTCLAALYERGCTLNWEEYDRPFAIGSYPLPLPTYAFQCQSYWFKKENNPQNTHYLSPSVLSSCYQNKWQQLIVPKNSLISSEKIAAKTWLIFTSFSAQEQQLAQQLKEQLPHAIFIYQSTADECTLNDNNAKINSLKADHFLQLCKYYPDIQGVIYLWGMAKSEPELAQDTAYFAPMIHACSGLLHLTQALITQKINASLWTITCATASIHEQISPLMAPLTAMGKTLLLEHPELPYQHIDVSQNETPEQIAKILLESIASNRDTPFIAYKKETRYIPQISPAKIPADSCTERLPQNATYLITGGLGGLGAIVTQWLYAHKVKSIILLGRHALSAPITEQINSGKTADTQVTYVQADVTQYDQLAAVFKMIEEQHPPLKGIFHTAGILKDASWEQLDWSKYEEVFAAKITGSWNLHRLSIEYAPHIHFFVLFSSISSLFGSPGQANYAGANAYMDSLAHLRTQKGLPALSINWGPWYNTGMSQGLKPFWNDYGIDSISHALGLKALNLILSKESQIGFIPNQVTQEHIASLPPAYQNILTSLMRQNTAQEINEDEKKAASLITTLKNQDVVIAKEHLSHFLLTEIRKVLHLTESTHISMASSLLSLGMDSISAAELLRKLQHSLKINTLTVQTLLFENYSLDQILSILEEKLNEYDKKSEPIKPEEIHPLTFLSLTQTAIWNYIHEQPHNNAYIISNFFTLEGTVNTQLLEQSIHEVIQHHPVLQCSFHQIMGTPMQHQEQSVCFKLHVQDLRPIPSAQHDSYIAQMENELSHYQFNLSQAPLIKSCLIQCTEHHFIWGITLSRLLADAHSAMIIYQEILNYYRQHQSGISASFHETASYNSYINQQMEDLINGTYEQSATFWRHELSNYCPPTPFAKASIPESYGLKQMIHIPEEEYTLLQHLAKKIAVTPANIVLSVYSLLSIEHFKTHEAFISILCSGRNDTRYQQTVGDFSSEVHLRLNCLECLSFTELAKKTQSRLTLLLPYQNLQPEQLAELGLPLPQISFDFQSISLDVENLPFKLTPRSLQSEKAPLWGTNPRALSLKLSHVHNQIAGYFKYRSDLYDSETITRLNRRFLELLHQVLQQPESLCAALIHEQSGN